MLSATEVSKREPHRHIGALLRESVSIVMARKEPERVSQPMSRIEEYTSISRTCCFVVAKEPGVLTELVQHLSRCNRTKPHEATLNSLLGILSNLCRYDELLPDVFNTDLGIDVLTAMLKLFKDSEVNMSALQYIAVGECSYHYVPACFGILCLCSPLLAAHGNY